MRRIARDVWHEIFPLRRPIPVGDGLREAFTVRLELGATRFVDLIASLAVLEVLAHPQVDVVHVSVGRERLHEKVVEHRKPLIHGSDLTPSGFWLGLGSWSPDLGS